MPHTRDETAAEPLSRVDGSFTLPAYLGQYTIDYGITIRRLAMREYYRPRRSNRHATHLPWSPPLY